MADAMPTRRPALAGCTLTDRPGVVAITDAGPSRRLACRGDAEALAAACGIAFPTEPCRFVTDGARTALWLGPDEWLLLAPEDDATTAAGGAVSVVDVSHRHFGLIVAGARAADVLGSFCPLDFDLAAFPVGGCFRTLFGKCEIVVWRTTETAFRVEAGRSFAPYLTGLLAVAAEQLP
jgi:sarcosine oxidase subunit gamma